jgi:tetratricopeptide (TPR) repeat protein
MATLSTVTRTGSFFMTIALLLLGGSPAFVRADEKRDEADRRLLHTLEEIRLRQVEWKNGHFDLEAAAAAYARVFREHGIDPLTHRPEKVAEVIRARKSHVALAVALDDWASLIRNREEAKKLHEVARRADPDPWRNRVRAALAEHDVKALHRLATDEAVKEQPPTTLVLLARGLERAGAVKEAVALLRDANRRHPADFWITFTLGNLFSQLSPPRQDEAVAYYRAALAMQPRSPAVHLNMGAALAGQGRLDEAIASYRQAIALDPKAAHSHLALGNALRQKGQLDEAIACYRRALTLEPTSARAHVELGNLFRATGKFAEALENYRAAVAIDPKFLYVHRELGLTLYQMGRFPEALAAYRRSLEIDPPGDVHAYLGMGDVLRAMGKLDEALAIYRKAIDLDPRRAASHLRLGHVFRDTGKFAEAIACYRKALELDPTHAEAHHALGTALLQQGKVDEAVAAFRHAIRLKPDSYEAHYGLGQAYQTQGKLDDAIIAYRAGFALNANFVPGVIHLGFALREKGFYAEACTVLKQAMKLLPEKDPRRPRVHKALEECERLRDKKG